MKKFTLGFMIGILLVMPMLAFSASGLADKLKGKILLAVEDKGKTYYVHEDGNRYRITSATAHKILEKLALGITNEDLKQIPSKDIGIDPESNGLKQCLADRDMWHTAYDEWHDAYGVVDTKFYEMGDVAQGWKDKYYEMNTIAKDWKEASKLWEENCGQCRAEFSKAVDLAQRCNDRTQRYEDIINGWKDLYEQCNIKYLNLLTN